MSTNPPPIKAIVEAALLSAGQPLPLDRLLALFAEDERPGADELRGVLETLAGEWEGRPLELVEVASGWRFQARREFAPWLGRLAEERMPRYSRALLETLALIVYRQPITRAGIEEIRGVSVSSQIIRTLLEREWIRVVGHRDVPGRPALFGTTRKFLDYFNIRSLSELPALSEIRPLDPVQGLMDFIDAGDAPAAAEDAGGEGGSAPDDAPGQAEALPEEGLKEPASVY
jgi:segregation and condensation protein B